MPNKKSGLGRGLESLIPTDVIQEQLRDNRNHTESIKITAIEPNPHQPRTVFKPESIKSLASSIKQHGLIQPIIVTRLQEGNYQLVAGERRWRAVQSLGHKKIEAIIRSVDEQHQAEAALVENIQRDDLSPLEIAAAYVKLAEGFNLTMQEIAERAGRGHSTVVNTIRLLNLPPKAKQALAEGKISEGHARQILAIKSERRQLELLEMILSKGWSVRQAEQFAKTYKEQGASRSQALSRTKSETPFTKSLAKKIGLPVRQQTMAKGGRIIIDYKTDADLEKIQKKLL